MAARQSRYGRAPTPVTFRMERKIQIHPDGCWLWQGARRPNGYGYIQIGSRADDSRRNVGVHRIMYELTVGPIGDGLLVCHRCDVRNCVNPAHLYAGTPAQNSADMVRRRRQNTTKLTAEDVVEIRRLSSAGVAKKALAERFGVNHNTVCRIVKRTRRPHAEEALQCQ